MKKYIIILLWIWGCCAQVFGQNDRIPVTVKGRVVDEKNEALPGVSVTVKDMPGLGVPTDINGKYTIKTDKYRVLVFSFIGFVTREILIKDELEINVVLKEAESNALEEIVVTATGPQKKATVTGAVSMIDPKTLKTPGSSITNALAGNVAGVLTMQRSGQPGNNAAEFWVRGISTFGAGTAALVLVDGFERSLNEINIEDIESFSVLKDASATAIYGSRGANGVVLVSTKRGKAGKVAISGKAEGSYNTRTFTPEFVGGYTYAQLMNEARSTRNQTSFYSEDDLGLIRDGLDPDLFPNIDWMKMFLKDGAYTKRGSLNFDGGGATARYFVSGSYIDEGGMYAVDKTIKDYNTNANYKRWNYRSNVDMNLTKTTLVKVGIAGSLGKQNLPGGTYDEIWASLMGQNPIAIPIRYTNGYVASRGGAERNNPWTLITQQGYIENWENKIQTNVTLEQDLNFVTKGLRFVGRYGYDTNNWNHIRRMKWPEGWEAERLRDSDGNLIFQRRITEQLLTQFSNANGERMEFLQGELHYAKTLGNHNMGGTLQYTQEKKVNTSDYGTDLIQGIERRNQRLAGRLTYGYKSRYFFDFNFGYNGSENFATGHQFDLFPAISGAWNIGEEPFIKKNLSWMNMFKLRYSYGKVGNDYMPIRFPYLASFKNATGYNWGDIESNFSFSGLTYDNIASNSVTWEVATKHNLGLDFSLFRDKISGALDYFHEQRDGIYMSRDFIPASVGLQGARPRANVGSAVSKGFDGQLKISQKIGEINFTLRSTMTYGKNEVLEYDEQFSNYPYNTQAGFRVNQNRGLIALGLFKDYEDIRNSPTQTFGPVMPGDIKYKDINGDGKIDDINDIVPVGATPYPNLVYGFALVSQWKNFDFNVFFQGVGKSSFFINGYTVYPFSRGDWGNILTDVVEANRWVLGENEDVNASYPRLSYGGNGNNYRPSSYWLRESSYLRLKTVEAGYNLPKRLINRFHVNSMRLFFMGTNVLTFSKFKLWDPEMNSSNGQQYPLAKTFTFGVSATL
ncbi:TonB-linked SusC/RagA family outer membrane protein [Arcticibacter tournemirensis]|uniref:TonB-dependent receptor n=1 Tax=Arcticibacter tournemirensis TaxID=699437 RepID=A0A5M9GRE8_9SPHI|nr:TonB-dependent receptor [Arcticibacter tournemirensis]KAA8476399.1 TonB-dependent receptor [Arcticibacter tournemirensis]TQM51256.1 TonB-linked SusC/RagA family outer membrane protein [Arcticibacter tournemirensis]